MNVLLIMDSVNMTVLTMLGVFDVAVEKDLYWKVTDSIVQVWYVCLSED